MPQHPLLCHTSWPNFTKGLTTWPSLPLMSPPPHPAPDLACVLRYPAVSLHVTIVNSLPPAKCRSLFWPRHTRYSGPFVLLETLSSIGFLRSCLSYCPPTPLVPLQTLLLDPTPHTVSQHRRSPDLLPFLSSHPLQLVVETSPLKPRSSLWLG